MKIFVIQAQPAFPKSSGLRPTCKVARVDASQYAITARSFNKHHCQQVAGADRRRNVYTPLYSGVSWDAQDILLKNNDRIRGLRKFPQILRRG